MQPKWRKSSKSNPSGNSVEVLELPDGKVAIRESDEPDKTIVTTREKLGLFFAGVKEGEFDDLT